MNNVIEKISGHIPGRFRERIPVYAATLLWAVFSEIKGRGLINKYYPMGVSIIGSNIGQRGEQLALVLAYAAAVLIIFLLCDLVYKGIRPGHDRERAFLLYALPVFLILFSIVSVYFGISLNLESYYQDDERLIWMSAVRRFPFQFVYTSFIFMVSFFLFPVIVAPTVLKVLLCSLVYGYLILRARERFGTQMVYFLYGLLMLKSFHDYGVAVHRMHWYGWVYLFMALKLYFDSLETKEHSALSIIAMEFIISFLTIWRREGIYLLILGGAAALSGLCKEEGCSIRHYKI